MINKNTFTFRRQGLLVVTVLVLFLSACIEIDMPQPQYPAGQGQTIYVIDSSKMEFAFDSAFVLNLNQNFKDSSYTYVDARSTTENNGGTTVINGGSNENGGGNPVSSSTETEVKEIRNGVLIHIKEPQKVDFVHHKTPSTIKNLKEKTDNLGAIISIGFFNSDGTLKFPMELKNHYFHGKDRTDMVLKIGKKFEIVPFDDYLADNAETYICGLPPINGENSDKEKFRTIVGVTQDGSLLILCAKKYLQDSYDILITAGAMPAQTLILAEENENFTYAFNHDMGWTIQNYKNEAMTFLITE